MIRRLRFKLVTVCIVSLLLVLTVIMTILNAVNYRDLVWDADSILNVVRSGEGVFPIPENAYNWREDGPRYKSPELLFEIRFFLVLLDEDGEMQSSNVQQISALDEESIADYARRAYFSGDERGFIGDYRFLRYQGEDGIHLIFLDCGRVLSNNRDVMRNSILITLIGLLAVSVLVMILSGRIIKPVAENYEKQKLFVTDAGHEIKTPITVIDAAAEVLQMECGDNEWLRGIRAQTQRLSALMADLIRLARTEEHGDLPMTDFPLSELVGETANAFQTAAKAQNKELRAYIQTGVVLCGHADSLRQLVSILLDNALKYSPESASVCLRLEQKGRTIRIISENESVQPLSKEHLHRLFDRFYRGDASRSSQTQGYGIGLSIAQAIVSAHKGKISASAENNTLILTASFPG